MVCVFFQYSLLLFFFSSLSHAIQQSYPQPLAAREDSGRIAEWRMPPVAGKDTKKQLWEIWEIWEIYMYMRFQNEPNSIILGPQMFF